MKAGDGRKTDTIDVLQFGEVHDNSVPLYQQFFSSFAERVGVPTKHETTGTTEHHHVIRDVSDCVYRHAFGLVAMKIVVHRMTSWLVPLESQVVFPAVVDGTQRRQSYDRRQGRLAIR